MISISVVPSILVVLRSLGQWHETNENFLYPWSSQTTSTKRMWQSW